MEEGENEMEDGVRGQVACEDLVTAPLLEQQLQEHDERPELGDFGHVATLDFGDSSFDMTSARFHCLQYSAY